MSIYHTAPCGHTARIGGRCEECAIEERNRAFEAVTKERDAAKQELRAWKAGHLDSHRTEVAILKSTCLNELKRREELEFAVQRFLGGLAKRRISQRDEPDRFEYTVSELAVLDLKRALVKEGT